MSLPTQEKAGWIRTRRSRPGIRVPGLYGRLLSGKSLPRVWMESKLGTLRAEGVVFDVGGGGASNTRYMHLDPGTRVLTTDIRVDGSPSFVSDLTRPFPLRPGIVDTALALNVLEHIYTAAELISEIGRILKSGGTLHLYVPFFYHRHTARYPDFFVDDYFRYGPETLRRLLVDNGGFRGEITIEACGHGPFTAAANTVACAFSSWWIRLTACWFGSLLDRAYFLIRGNGLKGIAMNEWPICYWVTAVR